MPHGTSAGKACPRPLALWLPLLNLRVGPETGPGGSPERRKMKAFTELWTFRELLRALVARNLNVRYQRSVIGLAWTFVNPLITVAILVLVFSQILRLGVPGYWAFLISGYFPWVFTLHTLGNSPVVVSGHSYMTRSLAFPAEVLVAATVISRLVEFLIELTLVSIVLLAFWHHGFPLSFLALPFAVVLHTTLVIGIALPIAAAAVFFNDIEHAVPAALMFLGFLSPVYYPLSFVPESLRAVFLLNPFAAQLSLFHAILYDGRFPQWSQWGLATLYSVAAIVVGMALFRWRRAYFAEIV